MSVTYQPKIWRVTRTDRGFRCVRMGTPGATGADGPNTVADTTALGSLTEEAAPLFLLGSQPGPTPGFVRRVTPGAGTGGGLSLLLAADRAAVLALLGTGTPNGTTVLHGDGSWQAVAASPGGASGQVQWNSAGAFAGAAALVYAVTGTHLTITTQGTAVGGLDLKRGTSGQTARLLGGLDESGGVLAQITKDGYWLGPSAPTTALGQTLQFSISGYCGMGGIRMNGADGDNSIFQTGSGTLGLSTNGGDLRLRANYTFPSPGVCVVHGGGGYQQRVGMSTSDPQGRLHVKNYANTGDTLLILEGIASQSGQAVQVRGRSSTTDGRPMAALDTAWADSTDASRAGFLTLSAYYTSTAQEGLRVEANATGVRLGFFGGSGAKKGTITGSRGGNAALAALLSELSAYGLITDSTTA